MRQAEAPKGAVENREAQGIGMAKFHPPTSEQLLENERWDFALIEFRMMITSLPS